MKYELKNAVFALVVTAMAGGAAWAQTANAAPAGGTTSGTTATGTTTMPGTTTTPGTATTPGTTTTTTTSPTATQPPAEMPNSNPYTPQHTTGPSGTPMPDSANTVQNPQPGSPPVACPNTPANPSTTTTASPDTAAMSCPPGPVPPKTH